MNKEAFLENLTVTSEIIGESITFSVAGKREFTLPDVSDIGKIHLDIFLDSSGSMSGSVSGSSSVTFTGVQNMTLMEDTIPLTCNINGINLNTRAITVRMGLLTSLYSEMFQMYDTTFRIICYSSEVVYKSDILKLTQENVRNIAQNVIDAPIGGSTHISCALETVKSTLNLLDEDRRILLMTLTDGYDNTRCCDNTITPTNYIDKLLCDIRENHSLSMITMGVGVPGQDFDSAFLCKHTTLSSIKNSGTPLFGSNRDEMNTVCIQGYSKTLSKAPSYGSVKVQSCTNQSDAEFIVNEFDPSDFTSRVLGKIQGNKIVLHVSGENIEIDLTSSHVVKVTGLTYYFDAYHNVSCALKQLSESYAKFDKLLCNVKSKKYDTNVLKNAITSSSNILIKFYYSKYVSCFSDLNEDMSTTESSEVSLNDLLTSAIPLSPSILPPFPPIMPTRLTRHQEELLLPYPLAHEVFHEESEKITPEELNNMIGKLTAIVTVMEKECTDNMTSVLDFGRDILSLVITEQIKLPNKPDENDSDVCKILYSMCYSQFKDYHALKYQISINQRNRMEPATHNPMRMFTYTGSIGRVSLRSASSGLGRQVSGGVNSQVTPDHQISASHNCSNDYNDYMTCIICMDKPSEVVFMNCKHSHVCIECFNNIQSKSNNHSLFCPTCKDIPSYVVNIKKTHLSSRLECPFCVEKNAINVSASEQLSSVDETTDQIHINIDKEDDTNLRPSVKLAKLSNRAVVMFVKCGCLSSCNECVAELYEGRCLTCNMESQYVNVFI